MNLSKYKTISYPAFLIVFAMSIASCGDAGETPISGEWLVSEEKQIMPNTNGKVFYQRLIMSVSPQQVSMIGECEFDGKKVAVMTKSSATITDSEISISSSNSKSSLENGIFCAAVIQAGNFLYSRMGDKLTFRTMGNDVSQTFQKIR